MLLRAFVFLCAVVLVAALPVGAAAANVIRPSSVNESATLSAGTHTLRLECPSPSVALNAAVIRKSPGVTVRRSLPGRRPGDWRFHVAAESGGSRVRSVLRCVRLNVPAGLGGARLTVKTRRSIGIPVPPGATAAVRTGCGRPWLATGYALDRGSSGDVRLTSVVPSAHGWRFVLKNVGAAEARASVSVRCLRQRVTSTSGSAELKLRAMRPARGNLLGTRSTTTFSMGCGPGRFNLATGFAIDPAAPLELATTGPTRAQWGRWTFVQTRPGNSVASYLVCLGTRSGFH
jgi:hypothetical protein